MTAGSRSSLHRRVKIISNQLAARADPIDRRVAMLLPAQREIYAAWKMRFGEWCNLHPNGSAFELTINGSAGPKLPLEISQLIFPPCPRIPANATIGDAMRIWNDFAYGAPK